MLNAEIVAVEEQETRVMAEGFVQNVYNDLNDIKHSFFVIGFRLTEANNLKYYKALGYQNITELAEDKFGFKKTVTYELMQIYALAHNVQSPMRIADKYDKYSKSQLAEFCRLRYCPDDFMKIVSPLDTVADIKEAVKNWNKYVAVHSYTPKAGSVLELLEKYKEPKAPAAQSVVQGQLPGQTVIDISAVQSVEELEEVSEEALEIYSSNNAAKQFSEYSEKPEVSGKSETVAEAPAPAMTDGELIDYCLKRRIGTIKKFEIYTKFNESPSRNEFINFITDLYGIGEYHSPVINFNYGPKIGIIISRKNNSKIELPWTYVTGRISRLIELNEYLSADEQAAYIEWKASRDGLVVNVEPAEPQQSINSGYAELPISDKEYGKLIKSLDELISPKVQKGLNLKNEKGRREWLNNYRNWGIWLEVPQVDKTYYRYDFANGAALIVEEGFEYWRFSSKPGAKARVAYAIIDDKHDKFDSKGICYTDVITWLTAHAKEV